MLPKRSLVKLLAAASATFAIAAPPLVAVARACPLCKVAPGEAGNELAEALDEAAAADDAGATTLPTTGPATDVGTPAPRRPGPIRVGLAADVSNAYVRHGYLQQDRGVVFQPTLSLALQPIDVGGGWSLDPYVVWFNSIHTQDSPGYAGGHGVHTKFEERVERYLDAPHPGNPDPHFHERLAGFTVFDDAGAGWFETQVKPGLVLTRGPLSVDVNLMGSFFPTGYHDLMLELGARVSYDLASLWDRDPRRAFSLRLVNALTHELRDDNGDEQTVIESSLEPTYRFELGRYRTFVGASVGTGWSPNGYYEDEQSTFRLSGAGGPEDEPFGYVSGGLRVSVQLPVDPSRGRWFVNAGVTYYRMLADRAILANGGDADRVVASVAIGIAF